MNKFYRLISIGLCAVAVFSATACGKTKENDVTKGSAGTELWSKESWYKVLADGDYGEEYRNELKFDVSACKNEYEGYQIMMTAKGGDVNEYTFETADLKTSDGKIFDKENFEVYNEKYITVSSASSTVSTGLGRYPDALLPFDVAIEYGENRIAAGDNQGIYVEAYVPEETEAGVYTGTFRLTVDGVGHDVPAKLEVYDYTVSRETHFMSNFAYHSDRTAVGEKGLTKEIESAYMDAYAEYRISTGLDYYSPTDAEYLARLRKYVNPSTSENHALYSLITIGVDRSGNGINVAGFHEKLDRLVAASIADGYDYLSLCSLRMGFIDEPQLNGTYELVKTVCAAFDAARNQYSEAIKSGARKAQIKSRLQAMGESKSDGEFDTAYESMKETLAQSVYEIANTVTSPRVPSLPEIEVYCVGRPDASTAKEREYFKDMERDQWWYWCGSGPMGYHIDTRLLEARVVGWMSYDYGFVGDVNWETVLYGKITWDPIGHVNTELPIDPYVEPVRCASDNGDGFIFYPGKQYGITGPVSTNRLHALRDGREDYELFYALGNLYADKGYSPRPLLNKIFSSIYRDITMTTDAEKLFGETRKKIIELLILAEDGVFVTDYDENEAAAAIKIACTDGVYVESAQGEAQSEQNEYVYEVALTGNDNRFAATFTDGISLGISLGGKVEVIKKFTAATDMKVLSESATLGTSEDGVTVKMIGSEGSEYSTVQIPLSATDVSRNTSSVTLRIYNPNEKKAYVAGYFVGSGGSGYAYDCVLYKGWNTFRINSVDQIKWDNVRKLEGLQLMFSVADYDKESLDTFEPLTVAYIAAEQ